MADKKKPQKVQLNLSVPKEIATRAKICALQKDTTVSALFEEWVQKNCPKL